MCMFSSFVCVSLPNQEKKNQPLHVHEAPSVPRRKVMLLLEFLVSSILNISQYSTCLCSWHGDCRQRHGYVVGLSSAIYGPDWLQVPVKDCTWYMWRKCPGPRCIAAQPGYALVNPDCIKEELTAESHRYPSPVVEVVAFSFFFPPLPIDQLEWPLEERAGIWCAQTSHRVKVS